MYLSADHMGAYIPATLKGAWDATTGQSGTSPGGTGVTPPAAYKLTEAKNKSKGYSVQVSNAENNATNNWDVYLTRFISEPLDSNQTISGTVTAALLMRESNASANDVAHIHIWVTTGNSDTVRGTLLTDYIDSAEFAVSASQFSGISISAQTLTSVNAIAGDRIVVEIGYQGQNTSVSNFTTEMALGYSSTTDATGSESAVAGVTNNQPWIQFSGTLTFATTTRLYLTADATAAYTPATKKGAWDKTTGSVVERLSPFHHGTGQGPTNTENVATNNYDVLIATFVSDPIYGNTTISGTINGILLCAESNADANFVAHVHAWVTQGDSDTVRGTLLTDWVDSTEWAVDSFAQLYSGIQIPWQAISSVSAQDGDRIVVEIGFQAQNTHTTNRTGSIQIGGRNKEDATGAESAQTASSGRNAWIEFSKAITFKPTYLFMVSESAPVTPTTPRGTWDDTSFGVNALAARHLSGIPDLASNSRSETVTTNPYDVAITRYVSDELQAQTISAVAIDMITNFTEANADADAFPKIHVYVRAPDDSNRGTLLSNNVGGTEITTGSTAPPPVSSTVSSVVCSDGDRIVIEVGARYTNTHTTARNVTNYRSSGAAVGQSSAGNSSPSANGANAGYLRLNQKLLWLDEFVGKSFSQAIWVG